MSVAFGVLKIYEGKKILKLRGVRAFYKIQDKVEIRGLSL